MQLIYCLKKKQFIETDTYQIERNKKLACCGYHKTLFCINKLFKINISYSYFLRFHVIEPEL